MFLILRKTLFFHRSWLDYGPPYSALFASVSRVDASSRKYLNYNVLREIRAEESYEELAPRRRPPCCSSCGVQGPYQQENNKLQIQE
jgi:hypothetical protein